MPVSDSDHYGPIAPRNPASAKQQLFTHNTLDTSAGVPPSSRASTMTLSRSTFLRFLLPLALTLLGAIACAWLLPGENAAVQTQLTGFPDSDVSAHLARPTVLAGLCFLPALAAVAYSLGGIMDRYIARQFFGIFLICLSALFVVWLLVDLQDNVSDFRESKNVAATVFQFYSARSSAIILFLLPYALLLSLLYSLGKFSSSREIVAVIQTGRSVPRVTAPLIAAGIFCSLLCLGLNYHWAPTAEGTKDQILDIARGKPIRELKDAVLYRNAEARRIWMIGVFPRDYEKGAPLGNVEVTSTRPDGTLETRLTAKSATWDRDRLTWTFESPVVGNFQPGKPPEYITYADPIVRSDWKETPWQLIKPGLPAEFLGIPDLNGWLEANAGNEFSLNPARYLTQWHYRFALPFTCLITVLLAAPLSIHFSRRGSGGSIFLAVVLSALMLFISSISLVLGEESIIPPALAAWLPNIIFGSIGAYLFQRRIAGRPIYQHIRALFPDNS